ncbi:unnamed protein product [Didymodactylos carnosus]|uniref:Uncharacterized protein n=1 Tax=Didymodactylos carnosus TaxID=1234261 RepID=A0A8S2VNN9_9BILA|nr:unnamed protein product [Didymodactylos carnosus]CAF4403729.1 unnamed protein product [Didymodactylos carnosus]
MSLATQTAGLYLLGKKIRVSLLTLPGVSTRSYCHARACQQEVIATPWTCQQEAIATPWTCQQEAIATPWACQQEAIATPWACQQGAKMKKSSEYFPCGS